MTKLDHGLGSAFQSWIIHAKALCSQNPNPHYSKKNKPKVTLHPGMMEFQVEQGLLSLSQSDLAIPIISPTRNNIQ
jgi:hypothetical protein